MNNSIPVPTSQHDVGATYDPGILSAQRAQEINDRYVARPLPLQREVLPPRPFPFDALGPILGPVARRIHEIVRAPEAICGQSVFAAAALMAQPYADVCIDGRIHPLSLFMVTAAESGDRKSAVDSIVLKPVRDHERTLAQNCVREKQEYRDKFDAWKMHRDMILRKKPETIATELRKLPQEPARPLEPYLLLEEPSYEGLVKLYAVGQPSIGLFSDEGGRMFGGYAMGRENMLKTACGLSSLWDGKPITRIRGGDENLLLYGRRFSSHLMIQEVVLANVLKNDLLVGQGLIARCLIVAPVSNAGERPYNPVDVSQDSTLQGFYAHATALLQQPLPLADKTVRNELSPRRIGLSATAKEAWVRFHDEIDCALGSNGPYYGIRRSANKAAEQALRIGGVLTIVENFEAADISIDAMERAIELVRFYLGEALRIADISCVDTDLDLAQAVHDWMMKRASAENGAQKTFSLQEIYQRAGPRGVRNKQMAQKVMGILEEHKMVERAGHEKLEWRLNVSLENQPRRR